MGEQLAIVQCAEPQPLTRPDDSIAHAQAFEHAAREAARHVRNEKAPATLRAYAHQWAEWCNWCSARQLPRLPVSPAQLIVYLTDRSIGGAAPNSVRLALAAISVTDRRMRITPTDRHPPPVRSDPLVRAWLDGWSKENPIAPKRKAPTMTTQQLDLLLQRAQERPRSVPGSAHVAMYARDRCMLLLGIAGALRISELVGLDVVDVAQRERGLAIYVRRSKTDQAGEGHTRSIVPQGRQLRCPIDAWHYWMRVRGDWDGPLFVAVARDGQLDRARLSDSAARRIITRRAKAAGLDLSSHSMRATFATLATEKRKPITRIAEQGAWASLDVLRGYVRQGELFDDSPSAGLLDE